MNRGLLVKSFRELWPTTLAFGLALGAAEAILSFVLPTLQKQITAQLAQLPFLQKVISAMLGVEATPTLGPELFLSVCWVHPVVLAIVWAHAIVCSTRIPSGEIDRGTIDALMSLPVSRWRIHWSDSFMLLAGAAVVLSLGVGGNALGASLVEPAYRALWPRPLIVVAHLFCLYLAVSGFAWFLSSLSDRRGRAITLAFVIVLASFLLNYLAQFWAPAKRISFLSILSYYRPVYALRDGTWAWKDMAILIALGASLWTAAGAIFARRDLSAL